MNILELYSGIGGMHMALIESGINGKIVAAVEISPIANAVYSYNFSDTLLLNKNIQGLTPSFINKLNINVILMSPPCQPFTRNGLKRDELDPRTCSFTHLLNILPDLNIQYILIENVKGFEVSIMRDKLVNRLKYCGFNYQEFILSPTQFGVSNTRHRYYCIGRKTPFTFQTGALKENIPDYKEEKPLFPISEIIEENLNYEEYLISDNILLKRATILDICTSDCKRSCCFTKSYGKYVEGTGSVFTNESKGEVDEIYKKLEKIQTDDPNYLKYTKNMKLRFFTPKEVSRLMSFPEYFSFPDNITKNQKYKLLGNSINVKVVSKLIEILFKDK